jgi:hypothetical protein
MVLRNDGVAADPDTTVSHVLTARLGEDALRFLE